MVVSHFWLLCHLQQLAICHPHVCALIFAPTQDRDRHIEPLSRRCNVSDQATGRRVNNIEMTSVVAVAQLLQELVGRGALLDLPDSLLLSRRAVLHQLLVSIPDFLSKKFQVATGTTTEIAQVLAALEACHAHLVEAFRLLPMPSVAWGTWAEQLHDPQFLSPAVKSNPKVQKILLKFTVTYANVHLPAPTVVHTRKRMEERLERLLPKYKGSCGGGRSDGSPSSSSSCSGLDVYLAFRRDIGDIRRWTDYRLGLSHRPFSVEREFLESILLPLVDDETYEALVRRTFVEQMSVPHANVHATVAQFRDTELDEDAAAQVGARLEQVATTFLREKTFQWLVKWHEEFGELLVGAESVGPPLQPSADFQSTYTAAEEKMLKIVTALLGLRKAKTAFLLAYDLFCATPTSIISVHDEISRGRELLRILCKVPSAMTCTELDDANRADASSYSGSGWSAIMRRPSPATDAGITNKERLALHIHIGVRMLSALEASLSTLQGSNGSTAITSERNRSDTSLLLETARLLVDVLRLMRLSFDAQCPDGGSSRRLQSPDFTALTSAAASAVRNLSTRLHTAVTSPSSSADAEAMKDTVAAALVELACNVPGANERAALVDEVAKMFLPPAPCTAPRVALLLRCSSLLEVPQRENCASLRAAISAWENDAAVLALDVLGQSASALMLLPSLRKIQDRSSEDCVDTVDEDTSRATRATATTGEMDVMRKRPREEA